MGNSQLELIAIVWEDSTGSHKVCNNFECHTSFFPTYDGQEYEAFFAQQKELMQVKTVTLVWGNEGIAWYDNESPLIIGKICDHCQSRLGDWCVCSFCGSVVYGSEHDCSEFTDALYNVNHSCHTLAEDYMEGLADDTFIYEFTEDQL